MRLEFIASLLKGFNTVADIGADHGKVLKYALDNNYIKSAIAADINTLPLESAKKTLTGYPVEFYLSDGFKQVKSHYDAAVVTGMGPELIIEILKHANDDAVYILGPNKKEELLRRYLTSNGFIIEDEHVIFDGFYYVFIVCKKGNQVLDETDIVLGPILKQKQSALPYYEHKLNIYKNILEKNNNEISFNFMDIFKILSNKVSGS